MPATTHGSIRDFYGNGVSILPDRVLTEKDDGSIEGTVVFECHVEDKGNLPMKGAQHPDDPRCELYARSLTYTKQRMVRMTGSYFGIDGAETDPILSCSTDPDRLPIVLHKDFVDVLGGTPSDPLNGAKYDDETGEFLGFFDPTSNLLGVEYYFAASCQISLSYWTRKVPNLKRLMTIYPSVKGFKKPPGVKDFLLIGTPYRQVGSHYQVTENYLGSGPDGWNPIIYPGT